MEEFLSRSIYGWSVQIKKQGGYLSSGPMYLGISLLCKNNWQSWARESRRKKLYEFNEIGINILREGMKKLDKAYSVESISKASSTTEVMEEGRSGTPESPPLGALSLTWMNPEVQGLEDR